MTKINIFFLFGILGIVGCSSSSSSDPGLPDAPQNPIPITSLNAADLAGASYDLSVDTQAISSDVVNATGAVEVNSVTISQVANIAIQYVNNLSENSFANAATVSCSQGGSISAPDNASVLTTFTVIFNTCKEIGITFQGDMTISYTQSGQTITSINASGSSFKFYDGVNIFELVNYDFDINNPDSNYTYDFNFTLRGSLINGQYTVVTNTPFMGVNPDAPSSGQGTITGLNNSSALVTATTSTTVRVQVDADGINGYETDTTVTWSDISDYH